MRTAVPALLLSLLLAPSVHAQALGSCDPALVGSPACPYQWVGPTSVAFTGDGNGLGFVGMTTQCRADYGAGARMCKSAEVLDSDTLDFNAIPAEGCWLRPSWRPVGTAEALDESGVGSSPLPMTCGGWTRSDGNTGLTLAPIGSMAIKNPDNSPVVCSVARPVACCKPAPVGEPLSSLGIPIGAGALAGLSMMKGGA